MSVKNMTVYQNCSSKSKQCNNGPVRVLLLERVQELVLDDALARGNQAPRRDDPELLHFRCEENASWGE